jgi:hypothetical protein
MLPMRHGWTYSLFAGAFAAPFVIAVGRLDHWQIFSPLVACFTLAAVLAARLGGWLGLLCGGRDHGLRATAFTFVIYIFLCGAITQYTFHLANPTPEALAASDPWQIAEKSGAVSFAWYFTKESFAGALLVAITFGWLIFLACAIGLLLFDKLIRILDRSNKTGE